jgi:hypothetical protein
MVDIALSLWNQNPKSLFTVAFFEEDLDKWEAFDSGQGYSSTIKIKIQESADFEKRFCLGYTSMAKKFGDPSVVTLLTKANPCCRVVPMN